MFFKKDRKLKTFPCGATDIRLLMTSWRPYFCTEFHRKQIVNSLAIKLLNLEIAINLDIIYNRFKVIESWKHHAAANIR